MSDQDGTVDESGFGEGAESSIDADQDASGASALDVGPEDVQSRSADEETPDSHAADVAAGYDDPDKAPVQGEPDGTNI